MAQSRIRIRMRNLWGSQAVDKKQKVGRFLIQVRKSNRLNMDFWRTPVLNLHQLEAYHLII